MTRTVLVVDDKEMMRDSVGSILTRAGFSVRTANDARSALSEITARRPDCVVTDHNMPGMTGVELIAQISAHDDELPVILMTAFGSIEIAVQAMKNGAYDFITKPFEGDELIIAVKRAIQHAAVVRENAILKAGSASSEQRCGLDRLVGESDAMRKVREQVRAVASSHGTVLVTGESGVGKEVVARAVHDLSPRTTNPFLAVNCAALNESLLESELFGHEKGAFTGADKLRKGRFELANQGTLLLDEVSEVSPQIQAKLLRVLQERAFERVGSSTTIGVDVRIVATSNRDLPHAASMGEFRQDLFYRLNVLPITIPPLRERAGDVAVLSQHFVDQITQRDGRRAMSFDDDARRLMDAYAWPGNVRELQNICERAVVLSDPKSNTIHATLVEPWLMSARPALKATPLRASGMNGAAQPTASSMTEPKPLSMSNGVHPGSAQPLQSATPSGLPGDRTLADIERETIVATLNRFNGHRQKTAKALGIGVRTLGLKLKKWKEESLVAQSL